MDNQQAFAALSFSIREGQLFAGPRGKLTDELRQHITENKAGLIELANAWQPLEGAINQCCERRSDSDYPSIGLIGCQIHRQI